MKRALCSLLVLSFYWFGLAFHYLPRPLGLVSALIVGVASSFVAKRLAA